MVMLKISDDYCECLDASDAVRCNRNKRAAMLSNALDCKPI